MKFRSTSRHEDPTTVLQAMKNEAMQEAITAARKVIEEEAARFLDTLGEIRPQESEPRKWFSTEKDGHLVVAIPDRRDRTMGFARIVAEAAGLIEPCSLDEFAKREIIWKRLGQNRVGVDGWRRWRAAQVDWTLVEYFTVAPQDEEATQPLDPGVVWLKEGERPNDACPAQVWTKRRNQMIDESGAVADEREPGHLWIVMDGETLLSIACKHYGDGTRWIDIFRANLNEIALAQRQYSISPARGFLPDPNLIYPDTTLWLPK